MFFLFWDQVAPDRISQSRLTIAAKLIKPRSSCFSSHFAPWRQRDNSPSCTPLSESLVHARAAPRAGPRATTTSLSERLRAVAHLFLRSLTGKDGEKALFALKYRTLWYLVWRSLGPQNHPSIAYAAGTEARCHRRRPFRNQYHGAWTPSVETHGADVRTDVRQW